MVCGGDMCMLWCVWICAVVISVCCGVCGDASGCGVMGEVRV